MPRIVFAPQFLPKTVVDLAKSMAPAGFELVITDPGTPTFTEAIREAEYFLGFVRGGMDDAFFKSAPRMKMLQLISAGYDRVDIDACRHAKVLVANNGGANSVAVAEHTMMLMLAVMKQLAVQHANVMKGKWRVNFGDTRTFDLEGKTLGLVGLGNIGKKVARRARAFDMTILYYDIIRLTEDQEDALGVRFALLDELLEASDVVSVHVPLTSLTRGMMNGRTFAKMQQHAIFLNTCRGPVVDEEALFQALTTKQIAAAGLDVMEQEPPPADHKFFNLPNITITPHMAGPTVDNWPKAFRNGYDNIQRMHAGRRPYWVIPELRD